MFNLTCPKKKSRYYWLSWFISLFNPNPSVQIVFAITMGCGILIQPIDVRGTA